jgi:hypothetical protein
MGGFMAGAGFPTVLIASTAVPVRLDGAGWAIALARLPTVVLMSAMDFAPCACTTVTGASAPRGRTGRRVRAG